MRAHALSSFVLPLLLAAGAFGQSPGNRAYVGQDIFVASGQQVHNATCLFCSVQVEGDLTGHVFVLFGSLNVSGQVRQNATAAVSLCVAQFIPTSCTWSPTRQADRLQMDPAEHQRE